ncbi:A/G-specific adenine glycosylase [Lysobacter korlensis]|uniref:Adenine DNA glycosylase n=1 Tax=Lysobacter korlensis TaxID=553636 RepID=A0ABV6RY50_9GAMM
MVSARQVNPWYRENRRDLPWRRPGFPAWGTLVSEFMLQQTQVSRVLPRLEEWLRRWPTPADLAATPPGEAVRAWDRLGYPRRALALHSAAVAIAEQHDGKVPADVDALLALPGIGQYTARAIAVFAYGLRHPVVDTNVRRVIARAVEGQGLAGPAATARDLAAMDALLPAENDEAAVFNAGMMELGAIVCTARNPKCDACPLADVCRWRALGYPAYAGPRAPRQQRYVGSDREARGRILAVLRGSEVPVSEEALVEAVTEPDRRSRILEGLLKDGLAALTDDGYALP